MLSGSQETVEPRLGKAMEMRIADAAVLAGLAFAMIGCGGGLAPDAAAEAAADERSTASSAGHRTFSIPCALDGATGFDSTCAVERRKVDQSTLLAVTHPDGGFRRFEQLPDGSGLAAVAGADEVAQTLSGDTLEISIAANRYRFPATAQ